MLYRLPILAEILTATECRTVIESHFCLTGLLPLRGTEVLRT